MNYGKAKNPTSLSSLTNARNKRSIITKAIVYEAEGAPVL